MSGAGALLTLGIGGFTRRTLLGAPLALITMRSAVVKAANGEDSLSAFRSKFRIPELEILNNAAWTWSVRPEQPTIGATVISLRRPCPHFGEILAGEGAMLAELVAVVEARLIRALRPRRINYLMLMMVDHHVHFHVIPRYEEAVEFAGRTWTDTAFPGPPDLGVDVAESVPNVLKQLQELLSRK